MDYRKLNSKGKAEMYCVIIFNDKHSITLT